LGSGTYSISVPQPLVG